MIQRGGRSAEIGEALQAQARQMFHWWHHVRDGTLTHASFKTGSALHVMLSLENSI
jgi:transposase